MARGYKETAYNPMGGGAGRWQGRGVGAAEMSYAEVTRPGKFPMDNTGPMRSQGEVSGAGSIYAAMLNERPNVANTRNLGPMRAPSRSGASSIPVTSMYGRKTGKLMA